MSPAQGAKPDRRRRVIKSFTISHQTNDILTALTAETGTAASRLVDEAVQAFVVGRVQQQRKIERLLRPRQLPREILK